MRPDGIGDFILWLDAVRALRSLYPPHEYSLSLLANSMWAPLAEDLQLFDSVLPFDRKSYVTNLRFRFDIGRRLRSMGFDIVFQPVYSREALIGDAIVRVCGASKTIGLEGDRINTSKWGKYVADRWYSDLLSSGGANEMELIRNAKISRMLGCSDFKASMPQLRLNAPPTSADNLYYVLQPGAGLALKRWPVDRYAALASRIYELTGMRGVICGSSEEWQLGEALSRATTAPLTNKCGSTTITSLVTLIANAVVVVGNDTGALHIAAATKTPSVCIVGAGETGRFFPYQCEIGEVSAATNIISQEVSCSGCGWFCKFTPASPAPCITKITVEDVWQTLEGLLSKYRNKNCEYRS